MLSFVLSLLSTFLLHLLFYFCFVLFPSPQLHPIYRPPCLLLLSYSIHLRLISAHFSVFRQSLIPSPSVFFVSSISPFSFLSRFPSFSVLFRLSSPSLPFLFPPSQAPSPSPHPLSSIHLFISPLPLPREFSSCPSSLLDYLHSAEQLQSALEERARGREGRRE